MPAVDLKSIGDQTSGMVEGYLAAAERIEIECGIPSGVFLDVGCNSGAGLAALARRWPEIAAFGIEPVPEQADKASAKDLMVYVCGAERVPMPANSCDWIFSRHSIEHVPDRVAAVREFHRLLRPGGRLYVQAPIEPDGSPNPLHVSPFRSLVEFHCAFPGFREVYWGPQAEVAEFIGCKPELSSPDLGGAPPIGRCPDCPPRPASHVAPPPTAEAVAHA